MTGLHNVSSLFLVKVRMIMCTFISMQMHIFVFMHFPMLAQGRIRYIAFIRIQKLRPQIRLSIYKNHFSILEPFPFTAYVA